MKKFALLCWLSALLFAQSALAQGRVSSIAHAGTATQALQADDAQNPAMLWVAQGKSLWQSAPAASSKACIACHGDIAQMKGVAARYPVWDDKALQLRDLGQQIQQCRVQHQGLAKLPTEHQTLLALQAAIALQSRGMGIAPAPMPLAQSSAGQAQFAKRFGQLGLSCADCHTAHAHAKLGAQTIVQGHPTAYPIYRLEWQGVGSLQRRIRGCMTAVRATPYEWDSAELLQLSAYLMRRAGGMPLESPGVRP